MTRSWTRSARDSTSGGGPPPRSSGRSSTTARSGRGSRSRRFSFRRSTRSRRAPDEDVALAAERTVLANADRLSRLSAEAYARVVRRRSRRAVVARGRVEARSRSRRARRALRAVPRAARRAEVAARGSRVLPAIVRRRPRRVARPAAESVEDRLAALERLKKKHGPSLADVLARQEALRAELAELGASDERAAALQDLERRRRGRGS